MYKNRLRYKIYLFAIFYRCILEIFYTKLISPIFVYAGYTSDASIIQYIVSWLFFIILLIGFVNALFGKDRFWRYTSYIILHLKFIPLTVLIAYTSYPTEYIIENIIFW